jgi:hypothetical protein
VAVKTAATPAHIVVSFIENKTNYRYLLMGLLVKRPRRVRDRRKPAEAKVNPTFENDRQRPEKILANIA